MSKREAVDKSGEERDGRGDQATSSDNDSHKEQVLGVHAKLVWRGAGRRVQAVILISHAKDLSTGWSSLLRLALRGEVVAGPHELKKSKRNSLGLVAESIGDA